MKIDNTTSLSPLQQTDKGKAGSRPQQADATKANATPGTVTHLSHAALDGSQDIDTLRVEELQAAIREGRLEINADKIADKLIASVQDLLANKPE